MRIDQAKMNLMEANNTLVAAQDTYNQHAAALAQLQEKLPDLPTAGPEAESEGTGTKSGNTGSTGGNRSNYPASLIQNTKKNYFSRKIIMYYEKVYLFNFESCHNFSFHTIAGIA